jgi:hypothetical protein
MLPILLLFAAALGGPISPVQARSGLTILPSLQSAPLERDRTVKVELLEGITARDGPGLAAWTLAFQTGLR